MSATDDIIQLIRDRPPGKNGVGLTVEHRLVLIDAEQCLKSPHPLLQYLLIAFHEWLHVTNPNLPESEVERLGVQDFCEMLDRVLQPSKITEIETKVNEI